MRWNPHTFLLFAWILPAVLPAATAHANQGYQIEVQIRGLENEACFLAYHYGERQFIRDTVQADARGRMVFQNDQRLDPGMYIIVLPDQRYFELLVDHNQHFSLQTTLENPTQDLVFTNSPDNEAFYDYLRLLNQVRPRLQSLQQQAGQASGGSEQREELQRQIDALNERIRQAQDGYMSRFPDGLFSVILRAQRDPEVPEAYREDGRDQDQQLMYQFYKDNYWSHVDFSDDRLLRTPVFHSMLRRYFGEVLIQIPDTIIKYGDRLIDKSRGHRDVFRYAVWFLTNFTERSPIMGMDAAFVHMADTYYASGEAFWMEEDARRRIAERADRIRPLMVGQKAPELRLFTPEGSVRSLHGLDAEYVVIYFWESECTHCQRETPVLQELYRQYRDAGWTRAIDRYGLEWINVNDAVNRTGFRDTYDIYAIPMVYFLDRDKRILAKGISAEQLRGFLQETLGNP